MACWPAGRANIGKADEPRAVADGHFAGSRGWARSSDSVPSLARIDASSAAATSFATDPRDNAISELVNRNFKSNNVVVDINGGRPLSNKPKSTLASPIEVLVLDSEGNLQVRRELADHSQVDARTPQIEEAESKKDEKDKKDKEKKDDPVPNPGVDKYRRKN